MVVLTLASPLRAEERRVLTTRVSAPVGAHLLMRAAGSEPLRVAIGLPLRQRDELERLLRDLYDPRSPLFRHFLTVEQFTERFGPTRGDYESVTRFVGRHGLTVVRATPNRMVLDVAGPVESLERAFGVQMGIYQHPLEDRTFFAPNVEPSVEPGIPILSVVGLTDRVRPQPMSLQRGTRGAAGRFAATNGSGPGGAFLGSDMRQAYAPGVTLDGTGQSVGLFELAPYDVRDVHNYFGSIGQPLAVPVVNVLLDGVDGGVPDGGDDGEEALDIEQAIAMAPNLSSLIVYESYGRNVNELDVWNRMATDNVAKQLSSSWGYWPADPSDDQVFMEFAAQGQNLFEASGDLGAYSSSMGMNYPTGDANVVVVGGTHLTLDGGAWETEIAWSKSGGGVSTSGVAIPGYQQGIANGANQGSSTLRNIPDVSAEADFDSYVCANGGCSGNWGGTSLAAPRWAGFLALVNQQANGTPVGFLNPSLYALGQGASYGSVLHDIVVGNNFNDGSPGLFPAVAGYDLVTGWGSPTGQNLIDALALSPTGGNFALVATPSFGSVRAGQSAGFSIELHPIGGFTGTVDLTTTIVGTVAGVTATLSTPSLTATGSVNLTVSTTSATPDATFQVVVTGTSGNLSQAAYVTVGPQGFFLVAPRRVFIDQSSSTSISVGMNPVNGFQGQVALALRDNLASGVSGTLSAPQAGPSDWSVQLALVATADATTGLSSVFLTGDAGSATDVAPLLVAVSAATGMGGQGLPVDLTAAYNTLDIATDGKAFSEDGGPSNDGYAYSAKLLAPARILSGVQFVFGPPDQLDAVTGTGQSLPLPLGSFTALWLMATGVNGAQLSQTLSVGYTDGTRAVFTQDFSDWYFPRQSDGGEIEAVAMAYRTLSNGTLESNGIPNLYAYRFPLDDTRTVESLALPQNSNLIVHAVTLTGPGAMKDAGVNSSVDGGPATPSDGGNAASPDAGPEATPPTGDGGVESAPPKGCGCAGGAGDPSGMGLAVILIARMRWRRRRCSIGG
jgi:hypothetical protein